MADQYSHRQFFRKTPNSFLASYFVANGINLGFDLSKLKENDADAIFNAFSKLSEDQQANIEANFQDINSIACDGGIAALVDESSYHENQSGDVVAVSTDQTNSHKDNPFAEEIAAIEGLHAKAMWAFLERKTYWQGASLFLRADNVSFAFWKKRNDLPNVLPDVTDQAIQALEKAISNFFHTTEGRGRNCKVEPYRRHNKEYFFTYPEDYARTSVEWIKDNLSPRSRHPAFEIIFVYCQEEGSLDIFAPRNRKAIPELQKIFAKTILKLKKLENGEIDDRVYDLAPLSNSSFEFKIEPDSEIARIEVTHLRLSLKHGDKGRRITLEANPTKNPKAVYDLLEELKPPPYFITQVGLKVTYHSSGTKRAGTKRFNLTYPNTCNLNHDGREGEIRKLLKASGLEPSKTATAS